MLRLILDLDPTDPAFGLALDEALLESALRGTDALRFWVNKRCVIVGRSQSVSSEVDLPHLRELRIPVLRRISGGGTVYHYPGNLNVSLYLSCGRELGDVSQAYETLGEAIATALSQHAIAAHHDGNIIQVGGKKIAGAAQARRGASLLYHMSILIRPSKLPIDGLLLAMRPSYATRHVPSHPLPVRSLHEISSGVTVTSVVERISERMSAVLGKRLQQGDYTKRELERSKRLRDEKYGRDEWNLLR
ncbi:MAG TPA: lipoate--protein ligase family protein [Candidatus Acetothermia bacterium]|nr:lipoate--protein ligase family protein [Candidatus Acetothermia bacterium]HEX32573.1 lipoate--protein ligase family protein [Candidatus Acetothermia bacterium]